MISFRAPVSEINRHACSDPAARERAAAEHGLGAHAIFVWLSRRKMVSGQKTPSLTLRWTRCGRIGELTHARRCDGCLSAWRFAK